MPVQPAAAPTWRVAHAFANQYFPTIKHFPLQKCFGLFSFGASKCLADFPAEKHQQSQSLQLRQSFLSPDAGNPAPSERGAGSSSLPASARTARPEGRERSGVHGVHAVSVQEQKREERCARGHCAPARPVAKGRWHGHLPASGHGMTANGKLLGCLLVPISSGWSQNVAKNNSQPTHTWMKTNIIDQMVLRAFWIDAGFCCTNIWGHQRQADTWQEESLQLQWHRAAHICSVLCGDFSAAASQGLLRAQHSRDWWLFPASLLSATSEERSTLLEALADGSRQGSDSKFLLRWGRRA